MDASDRQELLERLPAETVDAYQRAISRKSPEDLDQLVAGIIAYHMPNLTVDGLKTTADDATLMGDLGLDSLAITEIVFSLEALLDIEIANAELVTITTMGKLRRFIAEKTAGMGASGRSES